MTIGFSVKSALSFDLGSDSDGDEFMTLCEFCILQQSDGRCSDGLSIPKKMRCVGFTPGIEKFCASPADYSGLEQLKQMALFFGLAGKELNRVLLLTDAAKRPETLKS